ncbi:VanW family protein [Solicola gregarius]|uniref:VanW family protein n=1 Tax=Solicola gregarius TaxID=2908642 RepID=A0AA46YPN5_9ACTN|nr:VanW family protein [Solicola gregarius]UYM07798.1 VanW family protein [Solicola gregarius]
MRARHGSTSYTVTSSEAGLSIDVAQTVSAAGVGRTVNPLEMIDRVTGGVDVEPVVAVDQDALDSTVDRLSKQIDRPAVEGTIRFSDGRPKPAYPRPGLRLDAAAAGEALRAAFQDRRRSLELPVQAEPTEISRRDVERTLDRFARPAMSAPVVVTGGRRDVQLTPTTIGDSLRLRVRGGELTPRVDRKSLARHAADALEPLTRRPRPATVVLRGGSPQVRARKAGSEPNMARLATDIVAVLTKTGEDRTVAAQTREVVPKFSTSDARRLQVEEPVSEFTTEFPHSGYRNTNLGRAASLINGTVLKPGQTFSFNDVVGERTADNGFTEGYIIDDGVLVEDFGGGVSQVATTVYNAAFFAGLKDVEHNPHSLYFDRYPMGREATVAWGALDLRFENNTPYGVLIETWIEPSTPSTDGRMHARMWSTKYWDIEAGRSDRYNLTEPDVRYDTSEECVEQTGFGGFDVDVYRYFNRNGERVKTETDEVTYDAADTIYCRPDPR